MRASQVENLYILNISDSSIMICGETGRVMSKSVGVYIQNAAANEEDEKDYSNHSYFTKGIPAWPEDDEADTWMSSDSSESVIQVKSVKILSLCAGAACQVGSNRTVDLESRLKWIQKSDSSKPEAG
ncbi:spore germination protein GerPE [Paenibacillus dakarensis]|uniref:spore germination protein GerPE n=1 Tax=Paenibacillus dakarensis TaxID=1527293 RepID=UPI0006D5B64F|nr:spore germination protein GerPE [Paenibacillus dakarensis]